MKTQIVNAVALFLIILTDFIGANLTIIKSWKNPETENWIGCFSTFEEAESAVSKTQNHELFLKGPRKGQIKSTSETYKINGRNYDWYEVVNLMDWISKE